MKLDKLSAANQSILESCPSNIVITNKDNVVIQISSELCDLLELDANLIVNKMSVSEHPILGELLNSAKSIEITNNDGTAYKFSHMIFNDADDKLQTHVFTNISTMLDLYNENQRLMEEARQLQLIDSDTSLLTHRALLLVLESQLSQCRRYETVLSVIKLNLNIEPDNPDFKLKAVKISRLLKDQLRWSDMIARSSEQQFTIILPETDQIDALALISKLKQKITLWPDNYPITFAHVEWSKTMSSSDLLESCEKTITQNTIKINEGQDVA